MTVAHAFDVALCALILVTATLALTGRDLFGALAFFIVYGILIALAWATLGAVDVALAEAAIGAGITGVLLIGAWRALRREIRDDDPHASPAVRIAAALGAAALAGLLVAAVMSLAPDRPNLAAAVDESRTVLDLGNPVTAVLLGFRAYDTLMESVVLLVALVAIWSLTPAALWGGIPGPRHHSRAEGVMASFGRLLPPIGLLAGVYLVWAGSDRPGGAFQAGTMLAAVWLLVVLTGHADEPRVASRPLRAMLVAGPAVFLAVGAAGAVAGIFLGYPDGAAKPVILLIEYALAASIAATLALLVAGVPRRLS